MTVEVKICGLSTPETVDAAVEAEADYVGFVSYPPSPRHVSTEQLKALVQREIAHWKSVVSAAKIKVD